MNELGQPLTTDQRGTGFVRVGNGTVDIGAYESPDPGTTRTPTLIAPADNTRTKGPISVSFTLPEAALPGSLKLQFGATSLTLATSQETAGAHSFTFDPANPGTAPEIASVLNGPVSDSSYAVTLIYQDALGNPAASDVNAPVDVDTTTLTPVLLAPAANSTLGTNIDVNYALPEAPMPGTLKLAFGPHVLTMSSLAEISGGAVSFVFDPANPTAAPAIASGGPIPDGTYTVTLSYQDDLGNPVATATSLNVTVDAVPNDPVTTLLASKGGAVPNAGADPRIQAGAVWTGFGVPAVNAFGQVVFVGRWSAPKAGSVPAQSGVGIFRDDTLLLKAGEPVVGSGSAVVRSFKDPVLSDGGTVAFIATLGGTGVTSADDSVVVAEVHPFLMVLAREGSEAPTGDGALWKSFTNIAYAWDESGELALYIDGRLLVGTGSPAVTTGNDALVAFNLASAFVGLPPDLATLVREGGPVAGALPTELAKSWRFLSNVSGSPGQGRALNTAADSPMFQMTLSSGRQAVVKGNGTGVETFLLPGGALGGTALPAAQWKGFGAFSTGLVTGLTESGQAFKMYAMRAVLQSGIGGVLPAGATGIFEATDFSPWEPVARITDAAPGMGGGLFKTLGEPVLGADGKRVSFLARAAGSGITTSDDDAIYSKPIFGALAQLARENGQPPEAPAGAQWKAFTSIAQPANAKGPLFTATLRTGPQGTAGPGGITSAEDVALYGVDSNGAVRELAREGRPLAGKTVKTFNVLKATGGSAGSSRAFDRNAQVVLLVTFTDGTSGIVRIALP